MAVAFDINGVSEFLSVLGLHVDEMSGTSMTGWMEAGPQHHQPFGIVHGGVWASIVETFASIAGSEAVRDKGQVVVGVSNSTDFFRQHKAGRVDIVATPIHQGRTQQIWQVVITRADDQKLVARGQVRLQNISAT
jgi:uncharacterized protein (TIGR00369 family)